MIDDTIKKNVEPETNANDAGIIDVDLGFVEKKRFRINGDPHKILDLNVSDLNIATRLNIGYPKLKELLVNAQVKLEQIPDDLDDNEELLKQLSDTLTEIDAKMRETIDYIFDAPVSAVCAPSGNMFDPVDGQWRFERILDGVTRLYETGLNAEFNKLKSNVEKKTGKYTKKRTK